MCFEDQGKALGLDRAFTYYAPGVGNVLEVSRRGGGGRLELVGLDTP